jgi:hypothetical protein
VTPLSAARIEDATERLYALLPAYIRSVDATNGLSLKALIEVFAGASAEIDREIDTLYDSMFVETAPEAALADLAALVATDPLRPLPPGSGHSARAFIANTVRYRRGKGTARVLEALAADVGGFGAVAVEYFMRLARTQNLIDVRAERPGTATLIPGTTAARTATGFDVLPRLVDVRSIARLGGRHHVPHVGVHMLRPTVLFFEPPSGTALPAAALARVPVTRPWPDGATQHPGYFQLSAQPGHVLRLFNPDRRSQDETGRAVETELPDRLRRLPLHLETEELRRAAVEGGPPAVGTAPWFDAVGQPFTIFLRAIGATTFTRVDPSEIRIANLDAVPVPAGARPAPTKAYTWFTGATPAAVSHNGTHRIRCGFDPATGRLIVAQPAGSDPDIEEVRIACATGIGRAIGAGPQNREAADVPHDITDTANLVNFVRVVDATQPETGGASDNVRPVQTLAKALTEWQASGAGKRGLIVLTRCDREGAASGGSDIPVAVHPNSELHIVSAQWQPKRAKPGVVDNPQRRGYLVRQNLRFTIDGPLHISASAPPPANGRAGVLVLDGVELTAGLSLDANAVSQLRIRYATVRSPGGTAIATAAALEGAAVVIERAIVGHIVLDSGNSPATGTLTITDSIVSTDTNGTPGAAITASSLDATLSNATVLGTASFKSLEATNVIFNASATVTRRQSGCVRYSAIAAGSSMPRRFRCQPDLALADAATRKGAPLTPAEQDSVALGVMPLFLDTSLDEPTVAMLHPLAGDAIRLGGENNAEIGAFSVAAEGLRMANLVGLFDDYVPFGLEAGLIDDTRSSAVATRRNRP